MLAGPLDSSPVAVISIGDGLRSRGSLSQEEIDMRGLLHFLGWASTSLCSAVLIGAVMVTPAHAAPEKVTDCHMQCSCTVATPTCLSGAVTGCSTTCGCQIVGTTGDCLWL